ncbi:hypothetical protein CALCODRAFT_507499 [Calocera cornea HHB12733]|uniref:Uncharacterized protein n=1 Tax=Calocera cornea HHB12733 TaxID=1353952 RepID=A0A165HLR9_9BASI|nr:hypothetical protein CALCODRAFT_507499 [Calocera cornea HHB12733]
MGKDPTNAEQSGQPTLPEVRSKEDLTQHFLATLHLRSKDESSENMPIFAQELCAHLEHEQRRLWKAGMASEDQRTALSILKMKQSVGRRDSTKHIMLGVRYIQSTVKIPLNYFPEATPTRTRAYIDAVQNFGRQLTAFFATYPENGANSSTSTSDDPLETILAMTERLYAAAENAMSFPNILGYVAGILIMKGHVNNGGQYPVDINDPRNWAFLRVEQLVVQACVKVAQSEAVIRGGTASILRTIISHIASVTDIPFNPPVPPVQLQSAPRTTIINDVSDAVSDERASSTSNASPSPSSPTSDTKLANMDQMGRLQLLAPIRLPVHIPVKFPKFYNVEIPCALLSYISYPRSPVDFVPWLLGSASAWASSLKEDEGAEMWENMDLLAAVTIWLAFIRCAVRGTGVFYYALMCDCANFDIDEILPSYVREAAQSMEAAYRKKQKSPRTNTVVQKKKQRSTQKQPTTQPALPKKNRRS